MDVVTYTDARKNLKAIMDRVVADCDHTVVTRQSGEAVVMLSLAEWNSIQETAHLLSSPKNAARLASAIEQLDAGKGKERQLLDPDAD
jgi:antitoxin YefM